MTRWSVDPVSSLTLPRFGLLCPAWQDGRGTALHEAAQSGHADVVRLWIERTLPLDDLDGV